MLFLSFKREEHMSQRMHAIYKKNAEKKNIYGGSRFLGFTPQKKEVWVSMSYNRESRDLTLKVGSGFEQLYDEGAELAQYRVTAKINSKKPDDIKRALKQNSKNAGGKVTLHTLNYIKKLIVAVELKDSISHVNRKPSSLLFSMVAWTVFEGNLDEHTGFRWRDVVELWGLPKGEYFTIDYFPNTS